jgi:Bacterial regulatory proteins, gntR family
VSAVAHTDHAASAAPLAEGRWPLGPLLVTSGLTAAGLARRLGIARVAVSRAARDGLSDVHADQWAIHLGFHPLMVWGWAWIDQADKAAPIHIRIANDLRDQIENGDLCPGDRLPSARALATMWGTANRTAARAVAELRDEGFVVGGGHGLPYTVARTLTDGPVGCVTCGLPIELRDEHYPHRSHCTLAAHGWCDCGQAAHPECCPSCAGGPA